MTFDNAGMVSVFETTIRVMGGLLSAFELSGEKVGGEEIHRLIYVVDHICASRVRLSPFLPFAAHETDHG